MEMEPSSPDMNLMRTAAMAAVRQPVEDSALPQEVRPRQLSPGEPRATSSEVVSQTIVTSSSALARGATPSVPTTLPQ